MKFMNGVQPTTDLTYSDVFLVPSKSMINSRRDVQLDTADGTGNTIPIVVANMNAVAGRRMAETVARRGGLVILPQDADIAAIESAVAYVKSASVTYESPIILTEQDTIRDATSLIYKRAHKTVVVVDSKRQPVGIFTETDAANHDVYTPLSEVMAKPVFTVDSRLSQREMFDELECMHLRVAPVVMDKKLVGMVTLKGAIRSALYTPNVDAQGALRVAAAIGINGNIVARAEAVARLGIDILVLDTAHGHQQKMLEAIAAVRKALPKVTLVAGNVVTAAATQELLAAGADIVKVGVGPGAMCTTRMMTAVGRPQFSAVLECATEAAKHHKHVWADGGIKYPRDVALALAAGASNVMIGSWFAGTYESVADVEHDEAGNLYKVNYGMASKRAVESRNQGVSGYDLATKALFEEGVSTSRMYLDPKMSGVEDIIDRIIAGVKSSCTYAGAKTLKEFQHNACVGIQSAAGYQEGKAVQGSW